MLKKIVLVGAVLGASMVSFSVGRWQTVGVGAVSIPGKALACDLPENFEQWEGMCGGMACRHTDVCIDQICCS